MEARTRVALSGAAVFALSVAVVASVAVTNSAAFAESPGTPIGARPIALKPAPTPTAPAEEPPVVAEATVSETPAPPEAVTVPAPAPVVVTKPDAPVQTNPPPPAPVQTNSAPPAPVEIGEDALREAIRTADWDVVYDWAEQNGWSREFVDRWFADYLQGQDGDHRSSWSEVHSPAKDPVQGAAPTDSPAPAGSPSVLPQHGDGSKKDRSHGSPSPGD